MAKFVFLLILLFCFGCQTMIKNKDIKLKWLKERCQRIESIDPNIEQNKDIEGLKEAIGNAQIVMLGEQSHGDGSTFLAKTRIIKMLHKQMGFSVLLFESSLYDCNVAWQSLTAGNNPQKSVAKGVFKVWAESKELLPLWQYIATTVGSKNELVLAGFDFQFSGDLSQKTRVANLLSFLHRHEPQFKKVDYKSFFEIFESADILFRSARNDSLLQRQFFNSLQNLISLVNRFQRKDSETKIWLKTLQNIERLFYFYWNIDFADIESEIANIRDQEMANNLIWLYENFYPDKKLIVWGANSHLMRNRNKLLYPDKMVPMGEHLMNAFGDRVYTISFTSFSGQVGSIVKAPRPVGQASNKSIEYLLNESGYKYAFLNFRKVQPTDWVKNDFVARFLGHANLLAQWTEMTDGLFFIAKMAPRTHLEF